MTVVERLGEQVPLDLPFTSADGERRPLGAWFGGDKPVLLVMAYFHCPMLCDLLMKGVVKGLRGLDWRLGTQYRAVTISFDPDDRSVDAARKRDTVLSALGRPDAAADWPFLVGAEPEIHALLASLGFGVVYDPRSEQYAHLAVAFVLTPDGKVSRYLYGVEPSSRDLKLALLEASDGKTGSFADKVLMRCFRWDPATRRYGLFVFGFMRIGAVAIFVSVVTLLVVMWRLERRRRSS